MNKLTTVLIAVLLVFVSFGFVLAVPNGASTVTPGADSSAPADAPQSHTALAGNVTELTIDGSSNTQSWQGYYGNVSGAIRLANSAGDALYNWSLASPQGEVFASNESSIAWTNVFCFDNTNATTLEAQYGLGEVDADGVNETFLNSVDHDAFTVGTTSFAANDCPATFVYDSTGQGVDNSFEQVLLTDASYNEQIIYAALLEEDVLGFDGATHDFEMIVLEDGHAGDVSTTTYYFYVELE